MATKKLLTSEQEAILAAQRFFKNLESDPFKFSKWSFFHPLGIALGRGERPLEIAVAASDQVPTREECECFWRELRGGRDVSLVVVVIYYGIAYTCGPDESPTGTPVVREDLKIAQVEHLCWTALRLPESKAASQFLVTALSDIESK